MLIDFLYATYSPVGFISLLMSLLLSRLRSFNLHRSQTCFSNLCARNFQLCEASNEEN